MRPDRRGADHDKPHMASPLMQLALRCGKELRAAWSLFPILERWKGKLSQASAPGVAWHLPGRPLWIVPALG